MNDQIPEILKVSMWDMFLRAGPGGITLFVISITVLLAGLITVLAAKSKRNFGIWLISSAAKFSAVSAGLYYLYGCVFLGMSITDSAVPMDLFIHWFFELCIGPMFLIFVTWLSVVIKFIVLFRKKSAS